MSLSGNDIPQPPSSAKMKRSRIQLSCSQCRHAKLKCDRKEPCSQCIKKGRECTFPTPATRRKPVSLQTRLRHLESLVKDAMAPKPTQDSFYSTGSVVQNVKETAYVGATHWAAILDDIEEVKSYFQDDVNDTVISLPFNPHLTTIEDVLGALPARPIVDRLISRYFNSNHLTLPIIHKPTFQNEYMKFWANPQETSLAWVALLYALMCHASFDILTAGEDSPGMDIQSYRSNCSQCLILSKYTQPGPYTLEAFIFYMQAEFFLSKYDQVNCYCLGGIAVRLGFRMGLHRDSTKIGGEISIYQAEMRRRLWHMLVQIDLLASFHIGLPSMVQAIESDTEFPRNLRDEDFNEYSTELPPGRPETEMTPTSYTNSKGIICQVFGKIASQAHRLSRPSYNEVLDLDAQLDQAFAKVPHFLQLIPLGLAITDSPDVITKRFGIALLYNKARCVLHRKYLMQERENHEYAYSKSAGVDAALKILQCQADIINAVQPGGPLSNEKWFVSSLSMHDFLLAGTIIYLNLAQDVEAQTPSRNQQEMIAALERSYATWVKTEEFRDEAKKASGVVLLMCQKIKVAFGPKHGQFLANLSDLSLNETGGNQSNAVDTLGSWPTQSDLTTPSSFQFDTSITMDPLGTMLDMPMNFDWDIFDNHLRPQQVFNQPWPDFPPGDSDFGNDFQSEL